MRLLNLNIGLRFPIWITYLPSYKTRQKILTEIISKYKPSIVTFQEITDIFLLMHVKKILKQYNVVYHGHIRVEGGVVTFYKKNKWRLKEKKFTAFTNQGKFFSKQLADRILRKGILACVLENKKTKKLMLVINVHLTANYGQKLKDEERQILKIQLNELKNIIGKYKHCCVKQVIAGDFNANFQGVVIQKWLKSIGFKPIFLGKYCTVCPTANPLCYRDQSRDYQIDNILTSGFTKLKGTLVFNQAKNFISDHYGMLAKLG